MKYKVLITTSGVGQRLGELTQYTNKVLVRVGKKPAISHIIESYSKDTEFVITLGHFGNHVKEFLKMAHPNLNVRFVNVDKYQGPGSSLGYSMLKAKKYLQCPFIFHAGDTIVTEKIPPPDINWSGGYKGDFSSLYASFNVSRSEIQPINDKGAMNYQYLHIGLVGINDYKDFWRSLEKLHKHYLKTANQSEALNDCKVINDLLGKGHSFLLKEFKEWFDIGNVDGLNRARSELGGNFYNLDKSNEEIYLFDKFVVKFYSDKDIITKKIKRAKALHNLIPKIEISSVNFFRYSYIKGDLYSEVVNPEDLKQFLKWCKKNLWVPSFEISKETFKAICREFYLRKTQDRVDQLLKSARVEDKTERINGETVPSAHQLLKSIDFNWISDGTQTGFHGDLVLDNVIKTNNGYKLIDWRQDFGGLIKSGDIYYDLAKINHNTVINHEIISHSLYTVAKKGGALSCDILRSNNLLNCQAELFNFLKENNLDEKKVKILTCLIWLNSAPLHVYPFNLFLYYFGRYNLYKEIQNNV